MDTIVDASRSMILAHGYETFTLRGLGAELGVTAPAVYAHFQSKDDILRAVARREFQWFVDDLERLEVEDPVERLRVISRRYLAYARENTALFRLMQTYPPQFFRREFFDPAGTSRSLGARLFRARATAVGQAIENGQFIDEDPYLIGLALFMAIQGVATFLMWNPPIDEDMDHALAELVIDCMLRGMAPRTAAPGPTTRASKKTAARARGRVNDRS